MQRLLGYNLAQAYIPAIAVFDRAVGRVLDLRQVEFSILTLVDANGPGVTQKSLSQALGIAGPNLTVLLDRIEKRGLLRRVRSDHDKRAQTVQLTEAGAALCRQAWAIAVNMEEELLSGFSQAERLMLFELLQRVAAHRGKAVAPPAPARP